MQPDRILSYTSDGLTAALYRGRHAPPSDRIVIMLGGSDGSYALTQTYAAVFAENGLAALAVPYWGQPHLAQGLAQIAVETVETAVRRAQEMGFCQTGVWGISMGAQLALLAASLIPDIGRVAAVSPLDVCVQGLQTAPRRKLLDCSAFTWRGCDLPYCPLHMNRLRVLRDCVKTRSLCLRSCYRDAVGAAEETRIRVENIQGAVLLLSAEDDTMWPSYEAARRIVRRLEDGGFQYPVIERTYHRAGHYLFPVESRWHKLFANARRYPQDYMAAARDALAQALDFFHGWQ